ncbi:MAG TPA: GyrI-like domain-containing protein [Ideonella sp.]|uniref:GyrI-like domain-containing protein n=1 Tax=Ideonella sp. TaxID=1929293 RepID=UPI002E37F411|nr:GyrI-like domain-containing protein [Ideonella sp.]HEX5684560.1 GyrI-like domain-containing protein [Ideonella sp.]
MTKIDYKKKLSSLYGAKLGVFAIVDVPVLQFLKVDGYGDPNIEPSYQQAVEWLFSLSYALKFGHKAREGKDYVVPPLEGLWWADNPSDFIDRRKDRWHWTMMIMVPDVIDRPSYEVALAKVCQKMDQPPRSLRFEALDEGRSLQTLHVGSYDDEGPVLAKLHAEVMPAQGLTFGGPHHEIYLSDPRRTAPARLKTILRQPVKSA